MSVGSQALERSTLEAKDRESLHQIATAMGGKPGSRAKKADIITMILELAGVSTAASPGEPAPAGDADEGAEAAGASRRGAPRDTADDDPSDGDGQLALDTGDAGDAGDPSGSAAPPAEGQATTVNGNGQGATGNARTDDTAEDDHHGENGARADQARDRGAANRNQPQHQPRVEEAEQSNRRRRRRGRDRDRQGQPAGNQPAQGNPGQPAAEEFQGEPVEVSGLLDLRDEGYGFLRVNGYLPSKEDVYVSVKQVRQFGLRKGDELTGAARPASRNEKNPALLRIDEVNGKDPELNKQRSRFEELTPVFPDERLRLESADDPADTTARIIDLVAPIGKGQRGLIVSPPKAGKTTILKQVARSIEANNPEVHLMVLLVDERPEEVTDMRRSVQGEVIASTFDRPADEHTMVSELTIERAKRLVEEGRDVVIILDGITRLARAYNLAGAPTGKVMAGGIDTGALYPPKRFFGAARRIEEGGSLTILATALVETGSKMDEVIFEEFKGTANMELKLDRHLAERRIYPAIDVLGSSTRQDELLYGEGRLQQVWKLRRELAAASADGNPGAGVELLVERVSASDTNDGLLDGIAGSPAAGG